MKKTMIEPHGGTLVNRIVERATIENLAALPKVPLGERALCDVVCIATGVYSPLRGFMGAADHHRVVREMRLADGIIWPIPIVLPVAAEIARGLSGRRIALVDENERPVAVMDVSEVYTVDSGEEVRAVYGTDDPAHPGVAAVIGASNTYVAGDILAFDLPASNFPAEALTPKQTRALFAEKGWTTVVAFQTRNPVHRAHEYLQKVALESVDGLMLHPLVGTTKGDDIPADVRMECYRVLLRGYYPMDRTLLNVFPAAMRYAGPREAVLHAVSRKNYGCSHFIVGRDHAGVGSYYGTYDAQRIFDDIEAELGMAIMRFEHSFWCTTCEGMATTKTCPHETTRVVLSGTKVRDMLRAGERPPVEFTRAEIADVLIASMSAKGSPAPSGAL